MSRRCQAWFKKHNVHHYTTTSKVKAPGVERVIRTLRTAVQRYFEQSGTRRWIDYLPQFVDQYNNRRHSTTGQRPWDVLADPMLLIPHGHEPAASRRHLPPVGSYVRISRLRSQFEKEASGTWSREVFKVTAHRLGQSVPMLSIQDLLGNQVRGSFYLDEVQPIEWSADRQLDTIHATRTRRGKMQYYVSFDGYPEDYAVWVDSV